MYEEERLQLITEYVQKQSRASVQELCAKFRVSESTIRRDLSELEKRSLLKRTHGGAVIMEAVGFEPSYDEKEDRYREEKYRIARRAAEFIQDGDSILIDSGTTTQYMASELARFHSLTVVTNSIVLLQKLSAMTNLTVMSTGGLLRANTMALVGPVAEASLDLIRVDKAFMATNGLDAKFGLTTPSIIEASMKKKMISVAEQVFILADHTKIGKVSFARFGGLEDIDTCLTGSKLDERQRQELENRNVRTVVCEAMQPDAAVVPNVGNIRERMGDVI